MLDKLESIILSMNKAVKTIADLVLNQLRAITLFFDRVKSPFSSIIRPFRDIDRPSSEIYNKFITAAKNDIDLILYAQSQIRNNLLSSWNRVENTFPKSMEVYNPYDDEFVLEHAMAKITVDKLVSGTKSYVSAIPLILGKPILQAECSDKNIPVYYGKAWGLFIKGNESSEDGIRYIGNDGSLIVDEKDTFWEAEAVVLQEFRDNTVFFQQVADKDISLVANVKYIFKEPVAMDSITIRPYNSSVSAYYRLTNVELSDGVSIYKINVPETYIIRESEFVLDIPIELQGKKITSMYLTFVQESGYYMKYNLAYYRIQNNESWLDITGPHVIERALTVGGIFNDNVANTIENANKWILNYWMPGIQFNTYPELVQDYGINGYLEVSSSESKRKRYSIGIMDILVGKNEYADISESVTKPIELPAGRNTVSLEVEDTTGVTYMISFNDGMSWYRIIPVGKIDVVDPKDLTIYPHVLHINSDLSKTRKKNTDTGLKGFIDTNSNMFRLRIILEKDPANNIVPAVYKWNVKFGVE